MIPHSVLITYDGRPWWLMIWGLVLPPVRSAYVTIGHRIYLPEDRTQPPPREIWDHERVHVDQWQRYGHIGFALMYLLGVPWFAPGRYALEREAYLVQLRAGWTPERCARDLCSALYLWPWPYKLALAWFTEQQRKLQEISR